MEMETRTRKVRKTKEQLQAEAEARKTNTQVDSPKIPDHVNCRCTLDSEKLAESALRASAIMRAFGMGIESASIRSKFTPVRIIKNGPATVVFWKDGTKTVVKCAPETTPSDYDAFTAALAIKIFGNNSRLKKMIKVLTVVENPNKKKVKEPAEAAVQKIETATEG